MDIEEDEVVNDNEDFSWRNDPDYEILSDEQKRAYDFTLNPHTEKKVAFLTGEAGTGKSFLVRRIIAAVNQRMANEEKKGGLMVTGSTGMAAWNIGGSTLHSSLHIPVMENLTPELIAEYVATRGKKLKKIRRIELLILDEISMVSAVIMDGVDQILRLAHPNYSHLPFGGVKVLLCGDFLQLPPVIKNKINSRLQASRRFEQVYAMETEPTDEQGKIARRKKRKRLEMEEAEKSDAVFAFESKVWRECDFEAFILTEKFRQQGDLAYQDLLDGARFGVLTPEQVEMLKSRVNAKIQSEHGVIASHLYATNQKADEHNRKKLAKIESVKYTYDAELDTAKPKKQPPDYSEAFNMLNESLVRHNITLCEGAQVMLIANYDQEAGLVNGSRGVVIGFTKPKIITKKQSSQFTVVAQQSADASKKGSNTLQVKPVVERKEVRYPIIKFVAENDTTIVRPIYPWSWKSKHADIPIVTQIPLVLAWALTIHKSQGLTLCSARINLANTCEDGAGAYVALSRLRTLQGLRLTDFNTTWIKANDRAIEFMYNLYTKNGLPIKPQLQEAYQNIQNGKQKLKDRQSEALEAESEIISQQEQEEWFNRFEGEPDPEEISKWKMSFQGFEIPV